MGKAPRVRRVTIVGAGMAGMSAALRLLERGFHVRVYEQDEFVGGMLHSYWDHETETQREHGYHMFPNFYFNFWTIAEELGIEENFTPREALNFLREKSLKNLPALYNPGGPQDFLRNLSSGAESPPDLFVYMYSMIDILAQPPEKHGLLDKYSVNGFLHSRPYMTAEAAKLHQTVWETVWGIASYQASARSYQTFLKYSNRYSVPEFWFLAGTKWDCLLKPWLNELKSYGDRFELYKLHRLKHVEIVPQSKWVGALEFDRVNRSPSVHPRKWSTVGHERVDVSEDAVILAVTPGAVKQLVRDDGLDERSNPESSRTPRKAGLYDAAPSLRDVQYLKAQPMGSLQLYLNRRLKHVPADVTEFVDAPYSMTFLDFTQLWPDLTNTFLNVSVSDVVPLLPIPLERRGDSHELVVDLEQPTTAAEYVLIEVLQRLPITLKDVDLRRTALDLNTGEELFANMVGSWDRRPDTATPLQNLWLAGTYVKNVIDVATIEGAVITGLKAAEAIRVDRAPREPPVAILEPEAFPWEMFKALQIAWAPIAANAKLWSEANRFLGRFGPGWGKLQQQLMESAVRALRPFFGRMPDPPEYLGPLNWMVTSRNLPEDDPRAVGPIYWNYNPDGKKKKSAKKKPKKT